MPFTTEQHDCALYLRRNDGWKASIGLADARRVTSPSDLKSAILPKLTTQCLSPNPQVELTARWPDYSVAEPFENAARRPVELVAIHNLMEHYGSSVHTNGAYPRALPVRLVGDHNPVLV